jgi:hypothetical protein
MQQPTLVILAAGMASRYGSMKQVEHFGPSGETIMEYSIYDSIRAGFGKVVFIVREEFLENFKSIFEPRLKGKIKLEYAAQELNMYTGDFKIPEGREKPWGTAHAVLSAREKINEPFAVINADDFYGRDAFEKAAEFLKSRCSDKRYGIVVYDLLRTLSEHGSVNRGVCRFNPAGGLSGITERINISKKGDKIVSEDGQQPAELSLDTKVSMNFWCFDHSFFSYTEKLFHEFLAQRGNEPKAEFFIPIVADQFIKEDGTIESIPTTAIWFGVTYKEDAPFVKDSLHKLIDKGEYPKALWVN